MSHARTYISAVFGAAALSIAFAGQAAAETRSYVVSWFGQATNSEEKDCPGGPNPGVQLQYLKNLADLGYSSKQIEEMVKKSQSGEGGGEMFDALRFRGRMDGKPVSPYIYPATTVDPKWKAITGKYAYGFNLDGRGESARNGFEDPETHEKGVNNELYRALGCYISMRGSLSGRPTYWAWAWGQLKDSQPAWLITLEGADLGKDGDVTVTFDRALEHLKSNVDGSPRADATYRIDSDFRSHNSFRGRIKNGVVTISDHGDFRMLQNPLVAPEFKLSKTHLRMHLKQDGTLDAFIGGYQPWSDLYFSFASGGIGIEQCVTGDIPGLYWLMPKHADADPDPKTGQNTTISATYYMEGVPAFAAHPVPTTPKVAGDAGAR
ncbi:MAG: hypothetical protein ACYCZX_15665 [Rhodospirillaceae bacterium]